MAVVVPPDNAAVVLVLVLVLDLVVEIDDGTPSATRERSTPTMSSVSPPTVARGMHPSRSSVVVEGEEYDDGVVECDAATRIGRDGKEDEDEECDGRRGCDGTTTTTTNDDAYAEDEGGGRQITRRPSRRRPGR